MPAADSISSKPGLKVAVIIRNYQKLGGGETFAVETSERIAARDGFEVHVLANNWQAYSDAITFHRLFRCPFRLLKQWYFARQTSARLRVIKPDIVHTHERIFAADAYSMHATSHLYWKKQVQHKHALGLFDLLQHRLEKGMLNQARCRLLMPVSSIVMQSYDPGCFHLERKQVRIIPPGVTENRITPGERQALRDRFRKQWNFSAEQKIILFAGMNFAHKGLALLIESLATPGLGDSLLLVAGKGDRQRFLRLARERGVADRLRFLGVQADMQTVYAGSDVLALPSRFETFGMVAIEALAAGTPAVISKYVGARDIITDPKRITGLDVSSVAQALRHAQAQGSVTLPYPGLATWDDTARAIVAGYTAITNKDLYIA